LQSLPEISIMVAENTANGQPQNSLLVGHGRIPVSLTCQAGDPVDSPVTLSQRNGDAPVGHGLLTKI
jgi:hypothetical protein